MKSQCVDGEWKFIFKGKMRITEGRLIKPSNSWMTWINTLQQQLVVLWGELDWTEISLSLRLIPRKFWNIGCGTVPLMHVINNPLCNWCHNTTKFNLNVGNMREISVFRDRSHGTTVTLFCLSCRRIKNIQDFPYLFSCKALSPLDQNDVWWTLIHTRMIMFTSFIRRKSLHL